MTMTSVTSPKETAVTTTDRSIKARRGRKITRAASMVAQIRTDVQSYSSTLWKAATGTSNLAPLVANAFQAFQDETLKADGQRGTKLDFVKMFATAEQLAHWPETDVAAKAPGSPVQALFNGVEYLLRVAARTQRNAELETKVAEAVQHAKLEVRKHGLKGEEATAVIERARQEAVQASGAAVQARQNTDEVANLIVAAWNTDNLMDDFEAFASFVRGLLSLKYSERTADGIIAKARETVGTRVTAAPAPVTAPAPAPLQEAPAQQQLAGEPHRDTLHQRVVQLKGRSRLARNMKAA